MLFLLYSLSSSCQVLDLFSLSSSLHLIVAHATKIQNRLLLHLDLCPSLRRDTHHDHASLHPTLLPKFTLYLFLAILVHYITSSDSRSHTAFTLPKHSTLHPTPRLHFLLTYSTFTATYIFCPEVSTMYAGEVLVTSKLSCSNLVLLCTIHWILSIP